MVAKYVLRSNKSEPGEADIEGVVDEHQARGIGLSLTFLGEDREVGAALDPTLLVPRALAMPHQDHPLRGLYRGERSRSVKLRAHLCLSDGGGGSDCEARARSGSGREEARVPVGEEKTVVEDERVGDRNHLEEVSLVSSVC